ncbi:hypothetical protein MRB53_010116 [Persea americana]|uniref:Uncharacterized protein n=1 Tax=Persea americana TaxID=3435 RepID=A0ACC2LS28_PERAE|nr:hypothetical protein MRB53_010116 [Persea americana]
MCTFIRQLNTLWDVNKFPVGVGAKVSKTFEFERRGKIMSVPVVLLCAKWIRRSLTSLFQIYSASSNALFFYNKSTKSKPVALEIPLIPKPVGQLVSLVCRMSLPELEVELDLIVGKVFSLFLLSCRRNFAYLEPDLCSVFAWTTGTTEQWSHRYGDPKPGDMDMREKNCRGDEVTEDGPSSSTIPAINDGREDFSVLK